MFAAVRARDEKEMQLARVSADLLRAEAELARTRDRLLWTQMQLADAGARRERPDFLGGGEALRPPPVWSYGPATNAQPTSEGGGAAHAQGGAGARQDTCPSPTPGATGGGTRQGPCA
ncbi:unnamed protein product [Urochloa humidicola]